MKFVIGIDGGGTKTEAIAYNLEGIELGRSCSGFGNMLLGQDKALENIHHAIEECISIVEKLSPGSECLMIFSGIAGIDSGSNREVLEQSLNKRFGVRARAVNDAEIALSALLRGRDGVLTISGTGSISYGTKAGLKARAGGWGHILGDEGSGYFIALQGFKNMTREEELGLEPGKLSKAFMQSLQIDKVEGIKKFVYSAQKDEIAALAPIVARQAEEGDGISIEILKQAGRDLAEITLRVCKKLELGNKAVIGIKGSILTHVNIVSEEFEAVLKSSFKNLQIIDDEVSPAKGGYYLALKEMEQSSDK